MTLHMTPVRSAAPRRAAIHLPSILGSPIVVSARFAGWHGNPRRAGMAR